MTPSEAMWCLATATACASGRYTLSIDDALVLITAVSRGQNPDAALCSLLRPSPDSGGVIRRLAFPHRKEPGGLARISEPVAQRIVREASGRGWWKHKGPTHESFSHLAYALFLLHGFGQPPSPGALGALARLCAEHTSSHEQPSARFAPAGPLFFWLEVIHLRTDEREQWCTNVQCLDCQVE
jgi:hypothetical protein